MSAVCRKFLSDRGFMEVLEYRGHAYFVNSRTIEG